MIHRYMHHSPEEEDKLTWLMTLCFQEIPAIRQAMVDLPLLPVLKHRIFWRNLVVIDHWRRLCRDTTFVRAMVGCWDRWIDKLWERFVPDRQLPALMEACTWGRLQDWPEEKRLLFPIDPMAVMQFSVVMPEIRTWSLPWTDPTFFSWVSDDQLPRG
jgi:hypothetical protein